MPRYRPETERALGGRYGPSVGIDEQGGSLAGQPALSGHSITMTQTLRYTSLIIHPVDYLNGFNILHVPNHTTYMPNVLNVRCIVSSV